jgi:L-fuconolactonase
MTDREDWLNLVTEKTLEPDLPICDSHVHLKSLERQRYLSADFVKEVCGGHNIKQSIFVQVKSNYEQGPGGGMSPVDETLFVTKQIESLKSLADITAGFVGYVDLTTDKATQAAFEAHLEAGGKLFKGIRSYLSEQTFVKWQPNAPRAESLLSDPRFLEGFAYLSKYKLAYELPMGLSQYSELVDVAKKFPYTPIVITALGWPMIPADTSPEVKDEMINEWRRGIQMVAPIENIYVKLGGTGMPHRGFGFDKKPRPPTSQEIVDVVGVYYQFVIDQFGPKRCMFESNFPNEKVYSTYNIIWNAFKLMTKSFTRTERANMFKDTANRAYNLQTMF